jgi:hypothetical protein
MSLGQADSHRVPQGPRTTVLIDRAGLKIVNAGLYSGRAEFLDVCQRSPCSADSGKPLVQALMLSLAVGTENDSVQLPITPIRPQQGRSETPVFGSAIEAGQLLVPHHEQNCHETKAFPSRLLRHKPRTPSYPLRALYG